MGITVRAGGRQRALEVPFIVATARFDLVWRARRWVIAVVGTAVVFAVLMVMSGFLTTFNAEVTATLNAIGGDGYVVRAGATGPFTASSPLEASLLPMLEADPAITNVSPLITIPYTLTLPGHDTVDDVYLVGRNADGPGHWPIHDGRELAKPGEIVVDTREGAHVGDVVRMGGRDFTVVGTVRNVHLFGGESTVWMNVSDAQALIFSGAPLVSGFVIDGKPTSALDGTTFVDRAGGRADLLRQAKPVQASIRTFQRLMWGVAAAMVGSVLYLTALERARDFAVMKATGTRNRELVASLLLQAAVVALVSSVLSIGLAKLIAKTLPTPALFTAPTYIATPVSAVIIGAIGSIAGVRRAITADPALAFGA